MKVSNFILKLAKINPIGHIENYGEANMMKFIISEFNGWPLFDPIFFKNDTKHIYKLLMSLFKNGITPLFNLYVTTSLSNPNIPIIQVLK